MASLKERSAWLLVLSVLAAWIAFREVQIRSSEDSAVGVDQGEEQSVDQKHLLQENYQLSLALRACLERCGGNSGPFDTRPRSPAASTP